MCVLLHITRVQNVYSCIQQHSYGVLLFYYILVHHKKMDVVWHFTWLDGKSRHHIRFWYL